MQEKDTYNRVFDKGRKNMHTNEEIERVVDMYADTLFRMAMHHVQNVAQAQDIVQDVFMKYMKNTSSFNDQEHEKAWLLRVTINCCKDLQRHWWNKKRVDYPYEEMTGKEDQSSTLLEEVKKLPFHYRNAIYLFYYEQLSIKQIAQITHVKEGTVSSWLHRGKKLLKKQLEGGFDDE
ncbi:MAG: sigma-70 family RNA polymerase sigma factor [Erysipelotrichia bacterium]|nr:sigma-70 family RNA polymerase sigma factor [Erysipelotrichia bacterium]NCC54351.1 sigma-70 family RNA polymerase sigma factor [Erysipelotrichia bacterium]